MEFSSQCTFLLYPCFSCSSKERDCWKNNYMIPISYNNEQANTTIKKKAHQFEKMWTKLQQRITCSTSTIYLDILTKNLNWATWLDIWCPCPPRNIQLKMKWNHSYCSMVLGSIPLIIDALVKWRNLKKDDALLFFIHNTHACCLSIYELF